MHVIKVVSATARTVVMLGIVAPVLLYGVLAKEQPRSTLAESVARNSVDMMPVGGIRAPGAHDAKRVVKRAHKP